MAVSVVRVHTHTHTHTHTHNGNLINKKIMAEIISLSYGVYETDELTI